MLNPLSICVFLDAEPLAKAVLQQLRADRYQVAQPLSSQDFFALVEKEQQKFDCLILQSNSDLLSLTNWLHGQAILLPAVIVNFDSDATATTAHPTTINRARGFVYHTAEVWITPKEVAQLTDSINQAIAQFISLSPIYGLSKSSSAVRQEKDLEVQTSLKVQQHRLTDKLKERLGYLGVYYKRNPQNFFRHLPLDQKEALLSQLKLEYRDIVLTYFGGDGTLNQRIDDFVNTIFFADIPVSQIVEIHMDLMDEFAKQLKLEGRSEEVLLDYRLTLIDTIAHLCEMYRRSIPRES